MKIQNVTFKNIRIINAPNDRPAIGENGILLGVPAEAEYGDVEVEDTLGVNMPLVRAHLLRSLISRNNRQITRPDSCGGSQIGRFYIGH